MTVKELIEKLNEYPPEMKVIIWTTGGTKNVGHVGPPELPELDGDVVSLLATS